MAATSDADDISSLSRELREAARSHATLEDTANTAVDLLIREFGDSIVLTRFFATVRYGDLPRENRAFVDRTADTSVAMTLDERTPVLSLVATRGVNPAWNDRRRSLAHVGVPLASSAFVNSVPMIARLMAEIGVESDRLDPGAKGVEVNAFSKTSGVFYVRDAQSAVDEQGRKIISAQDFVADYGVRSVFGVASGIEVDGTLLVLLLFCNETCEKRRALELLPFLNTVSSATVSRVTRKMYFA